MADQPVHPQRDWSELRHDPALHLDVLHAVFTRHAFARHWHDYYVIGLVETGAQSFRCGRQSYQTPGGGLILLNPGEAHTGEAAGAHGFAYRALYPTAAHLGPLMAELGRPDQLPSFRTARVDDPQLAAEFRALHRDLGQATAPIERESRWIGLLLQLISRYGAETLALPAVGSEPRSIALARAYLEQHATEPISLAALSDQVGLSQFHLLRAFRRAVGIPPHAYLESVRIRRAQQLIASGVPLAEVAYSVGYSSQAHFTTRFRRIIGVTPGHYRRQI